MRRHILYCSICNESARVLAHAVSNKYGEGTIDHAIVYNDYPFKGEVDFANKLDFLKLCGPKMYEYIAAWFEHCN